MFKLSHRIKDLYFPENCYGAHAAIMLTFYNMTTVE